MILRDRDANTDWFAASDGTLEQRWYYCQNRRADVVAIVTDGGVMDERAWYSAYGVPFGMPAGDCDSDGDFDALDSALISSWAMIPLYDARADVNLDGTVNNGDGSAATTETLGWETLTGIDSRKGYAGYEHAPELTGATYHVRYRVLKADLGRWLQRDPLDYLDGMSLYAYVQGLAMVAVDPYGLIRCVGTCEPPSPPPAQPRSPNPGPPVCGGGTCGPASPPAQPAPGGKSPFICAGGMCSPRISIDPGGGTGPLQCAGANCSMPIIGPEYTGDCGDPVTIPANEVGEDDWGTIIVRGGGGGGGGQGGGGGTGGGGGGAPSPCTQIFNRWNAAGSVAPSCSAQISSALSQCCSGGGVDNACVNRVAGQNSQCSGIYTPPTLQLGAAHEECLRDGFGTMLGFLGLGVATGVSGPGRAAHQAARLNVYRTTYEQWEHWARLRALSNTRRMLGRSAVGAVAGAIVGVATVTVGCQIAVYGD